MDSELSEQAAKAADILDAATDVFEKSLAKFRRTSDEALSEVKKRVTQLKQRSPRRVFFSPAKDSG
jgi:ElaB/YqjD/DUF883 family membrane-anchored ribosome-binding protein